MVGLALTLKIRDDHDMRNIISLILGTIGLVLVVIAYFPILGALNWFILPIPIVGLAIGATSDKTSGRNLCIAVVAASALRLWLGGGLF
ncbi:MAG: hypothetical protein RIS52_1514 [Pseudomonadota bacterium]|jgi:hypothetical protein